jgi:hypothetical protein
MFEDIEIISFKKIEKPQSVVLGVACVKIPSVFITIRDIMIFKKAGSSWIALPSRPYEECGQKKYWQYIVFDDPKVGKQFETAVIEKCNEFLNKEPF